MRLVTRTALPVNVSAPEPPMTVENWLTPLAAEARTFVAAPVTKLTVTATPKLV